MDNKKMTKHDSKKFFLKIIGLTLITIGLALIVVAFVDFFSKITVNDVEAPKLFWMFFVGFPMLAIGGMLTMLGFKRGIMTYVKNESIPIINETISDLSGAFTSSAHSFKKGFMDDNVKCSCGAFNKSGSTFCSKCGASLSIECKKCGSKNESDAQFCNNCGTKMKL